MRRYCLTLDLQDDPAKIAEYKRHHEKIWPEIRDSLFDSGVTGMEIYLHGTRMFMIMDVDDDFSFEPAFSLEPDVSFEPESPDDSDDVGAFVSLAAVDSLAAGRLSFL